MKKLLLLLLLSMSILSVVLFTSGTSHAISISYQTNNLDDAISGEDLWSATFTVTDALFPKDTGLQILFDYQLYSNIAGSSSPDGFDALIFQPADIMGTGEYSDGKYDLLALEDVSGNFAFTVTFNWLGSDINTIGDFDFLTYNADFQTATPVPEPASLLLLGSGLLGMAGILRIKKS